MRASRTADLRARPDQGVRLPPGGRRHRLLGGRRRGVRLPRAQRRRQELDHAHDRAPSRPGPAASCGSSGSTPIATGPAIRARLGVVPQEDNLDLELTVRENLYVYGRYFDLPRRELRDRVEQLIDFAQLTERADDRVDPLSGRHEAPPHHRPVPGQRAGAAAPRRAHHRARPPGPPRPLGPPVPAQGRRGHPGADHPLHGRGRTAVRPAGGDGRRADRGRGLAAPAHRVATRTREVVELRFGPGESERMAGKLADLADRIEALPDRLLLYTDDGRRSGRGGGGTGSRAGRTSWCGAAPWRTCSCG